jgi:hypothetical protein
VVWRGLFPRFLPIFLLMFSIGLPVFAELCPACRQLCFTENIGHCILCRTGTSSGMLHLCEKCSDRLRECEYCRGPLTPVDIRIDKRSDKTYKSGLWIYQLGSLHQGTRRKGYRGTLSFSGMVLPEPAKANDHVRTPWGLLYWVGNPVSISGDHGWMPHPKRNQPVGQRVTPEILPGKS